MESIRAVRSGVARVMRRGAGRLGYEIVPHWRLPTLEQSRQLSRLFTRLRVDTVLDVGANVGGYRRLLRTAVGYTGTIVSFEPVPSLFAALQASAADDRSWQGHAMALGADDGELDINVTRRSTMSSFLVRDADRLHAHGYAHLLQATDVVERQRVAVRRLDAVLPELLPDVSRRRLFLKCDTQGFDMQVIAGAGATLARVLGLQVEVSITPIYAGAPDYLEVLRSMAARGFDVAGMYPVRRDELSRVVNFDCVMVNSRHPEVSALAREVVRGRDPAW